jgi:hypothetical protein
MAVATRIYGWYERADQPPDQPTYDPPHDAPCLFCGEAITANDVRTISMMGEYAERSFFYRVHRTCHERVGEKKRVEIDSVVWDAIRHHHEEAA